jgi:hypothetical protein
MTGEGTSAHSGVAARDGVTGEGPSTHGGVAERTCERCCSR